MGDFVKSQQYYENRKFLKKRYIDQEEVDWVLKGVNSLRKPGSYTVFYAIFTILVLGAIGFAIYDRWKNQNMPWDYFKSSYEKDRNKGWYKYYEIWIYITAILVLILIPVTMFFDSREKVEHVLKV